MAALAVLPVLPTTTSAQASDANRSTDNSSDEQFLFNLDATGTPVGGATAPMAPILPQTPAGPTQPAEFQAQTARAQGRGDSASGKSESEQDAAACMPSERAGGEYGQSGTRQNEGGDQGAKTQRQAGPEATVPLPHCAIDFDPDSDDSDLIAQAPQKAGVQVAASKPPAARDGAAKPPGTDVVLPDPGQMPSTENTQPATNATREETTQVAAAMPAPAAAPLLVTDAARGLGASVIDPSLPTDSFVFGATVSEHPPEVISVTPAPDATDALLASIAQTGTLPDLNQSLPGIDPLDLSLFS